MKIFTQKALLAATLALATLAAQAASIQSFGPGSMQQIVEARKGKPFVVVIWSLDCEFCRTSLDNLAQARKQGHGIEVVTISTDPVDDPALGPMMHDRLDRLGMSKDAWAYGDAAPERLRYAIDRNWHGEKPRSYWFNAKGERQAYSGVITRAIIDRYLP